MEGEIQKRNGIFEVVLIIGSFIDFFLYAIIHAQRFSLPENFYSILNGALEIVLFIFFLLSIFYVIVNVLSLNPKGFMGSLLIALIIFGLNSVTIVPDERMHPGPIICRDNLKHLSLYFQVLQRQLIASWYF
ncbi:MAG: hypothetical protein L0Y36_03960 [Planctomycetales bacterium]|nr:hypothetical protein [Planctomycetales bacterium]